MVIRSGPYGEFYACENFPSCKNTLQKTEPTGAACPKCGGSVVKKKHGRREYFACANAPKCDFTTSHAPSKEKCPKCGSSMFTKKSGEDVCLNENCK
jgi:DNA topoisomerase-1